MRGITCGLNDENIFTPYIFIDFDTNLSVTKSANFGFTTFDCKFFANFLGLNSICITAENYNFIVFFLHQYLRAMAGVAGFEPAHGGIKSRCLTAWPHPNLIFGVFYSIICIKGERSKLFTKTNSGFLL